MIAQAIRRLEGFHNEVIARMVMPPILLLITLRPSELQSSWSDSMRCVMVDFVDSKESKTAF
jgi:hypothetical protein